MIETVFQISVLRLWNSKQELLLTFAVPILFFSIFAMIFSRGVGEGTAQVKVSFIDDDRTEISAAVIRSTCEQPDIERVTGVGKTTDQWPIDALARTVISRFGAGVVVHIPAGFSQQLSRAQSPSITVLNEGTDPIGRQIVHAGLTQAVASQFSQMPAGPSVSFAGTSTLGVAAERRQRGQVQLESRNVFASNKHHPKIAMYAAGIAVMFLLFSANGAGASLLEEREAGTLDRLLNSQLSVSQLLIGKWLYITTLGFLQLLAMFAWGQIAFRVELAGHVPGLLIMSLASSAASASFALFLAALCRSRNQLNAVSVLVVLTMSAIGGSMVPRYIMSESMLRLGKLTFNGWALDGFEKIFWYDLPVAAVRTEVFVLCGIAISFGLAARFLAQRWSFA